MNAARVASLVHVPFHGYNDLLHGFNKFLHPEYKIEISDTEQ